VSQLARAIEGEYAAAAGEGEIEELKAR